MSLVPPSASPQARRLLLTRALRGFADGFVSVVLVAHLADLDFSPFEVGVIVTGTLVGSAVLTLAVGAQAHRATTRSLLLAAAALMFATGVGFTATTAFEPMLLVAIVGTMNPSAGDVSVFLPTEQAFVADHVADDERTQLYAIYNLAGGFAGALGALASGITDAVDASTRWWFLVYSVVALALVAVYRTLPRREVNDPAAPVRSPLRESRRVVLQLAALFSLDSAGSGLAVQSILVLWLHIRFDLSAGTTGAIFFGVGILAGLSQLAAAPLARRIGLVETMVFTHLPANVLLILAAFMPNAALAVTFLLLRSLLSQMDVPARQAFVMSVVTPAERAAAASVTNVPRSLASAATPALAGAMLGWSDIGWPLVAAGASKAVYDVVLLALFRQGREQRRRRS